MNKQFDKQVMSDADWSEFKTWIRDFLHRGPVKVTFVKKDGSVRQMICTLKPDLLPVVEEKSTTRPKKENTDVMAVYDVEVNAWRSFTVKSVTSVEVDQ